MTRHEPNEAAVRELSHKSYTEIYERIEAYERMVAYRERLIVERDQRIAELEAALRAITNGPTGRHDHESGCAFEKFACGIAYAALRKSTVSS